MKTKLILAAAALARVDALRGAYETKANWINFLADLQERLMKIEDVWLDKLQVVRPELPEGGMEGAMADAGQPPPDAQPSGEGEQPAGDGGQAIVAALHPGHRLAIVEAQDEFHRHLDLAFNALDDADDIHLLLIVRQWHEIGEHYLAGIRLETGFQHCGARQIAPADATATVARGDQPATVGGPAEQGREACAGVEPR